ncbi:MAG: DUF255 domain-containing protein [Flavobacteriales bacterium]|nr:DUF255 domain-containing protein [Flavobacteriales bacterium]
MHNIKQLILVFGLIFLMTGFNVKNTSDTPELKWYDWNEGVIKARNEGKVALIDAYTDWCHWCKVMDRNTYTDKKVIELINRDFVAIKFNPELDRKYIYEKDTFNGRQLLYALSGGNSSGYPTTYFFLTRKNVMLSEAGYIEPDKFEALLKGVVAEHEK